VSKVPACRNLRRVAGGAATGEPMLPKLETNEILWTREHASKNPSHNYLTHDKPGGIDLPNEWASNHNTGPPMTSFVGIVYGHRSWASFMGVATFGHLLHALPHVAEV